VADGVRSGRRCSLHAGIACLCADLEAKVERLEQLLARAYPFLTWPDEIRGTDLALDAEFDGIVRDVEVAIQHLPDDKEH
jgi:hypothetical protein